MPFSCGGNRRRRSAGPHARPGSGPRRPGDRPRWRRATRAGVGLFCGGCRAVEHRPMSRPVPPARVSGVTHDVERRRRRPDHGAIYSGAPGHEHRCRNESFKQQRAISARGRHRRRRTGMACGACRSALC
ncbi:hypothetical protein A33M_4089 [Rhodovulum sp. PH10]|nr:hypothetical protein A33M_4089 [Rhodovulum sp. PH10]